MNNELSQLKNIVEEYNKSPITGNTQKEYDSIKNKIAAVTEKLDGYNKMLNEGPSDKLGDDITMEQLITQSDDILLRDINDDNLDNIIDMYTTLSGNIGKLERLINNGTFEVVEHE